MLLNIKNIGIIKDASIKLRGITVIAGENGTGKSTVGKIIYSIVYSYKNYNTAFLKETTNRILDILRRARREKSYISQFSQSSSLSKLRYKINENNDSTESILLYSIVLKEELQRINTIEKINIFDLLITELNSIITTLTGDIPDSAICFNVMKTTLKNEFNNDVVSRNSDYSNISLSYNNTPLLDLSINNKTNFSLNDFKEFFIDDVSYIESPLILDAIYGLRNQGGRMSHLASQLTTAPKNYQHTLFDDIFESKEDMQNYDVLSSAIHGKIVYSPEEDTFKYKKDNEVFDIKNTAMGIKSLGMLDILLSNGVINSQSVLIIDEPEVHLHPKWQVEYAKTIVEVAKTGCKIIIATHSPFIVQALYKFTDVEGVKSNFYITEDANNRLYDVEECTDEIHRIFERLSEPLDELIWSRN